jgi:hypothetical protein
VRRGKNRQADSEEKQKKKKNVKVCWLVFGAFSAFFEVERFCEV